MLPTEQSATSSMGQLLMHEPAAEPPARVWPPADLPSVKAINGVASFLEKPGVLSSRMLSGFVNRVTDR